MIFHMSRMSPITNRRGKTLYVDDASCSSLLARVLVLTDGRHSHRLRFWIIPVGHSCLLYRRRAVRILGHEDHKRAAAVAKRPQLRISTRTIHRVDAIIARP